jgi:hypothetical protein
MSAVISNGLPVRQRRLRPAGHQDLTVGDPTFKDTASEAEAASTGSTIDIPLRQGEVVWLLPPDAKGTYVDNAGGMTLDVTVIAPLP